MNWWLFNNYTAVSSQTFNLTHSSFLRFVFQVLMELACFEPLRRLLCGMFLPQCSPQGGILQPCRSVCSSAEQQCSQALDLFSFSRPFNCHLLPDSQDPMECSLPWCFEHFNCISKRWSSPPRSTFSRYHFTHRCSAVFEDRKACIIKNGGLIL